MRIKRSTPIVPHIVMLFVTVVCLLPFVLLIASSLSSERSIVVGGYSDRKSVV